MVFGGWGGLESNKKENAEPNKSPKPFYLSCQGENDQFLTTQQFFVCLGRRLGKSGANQQLLFFGFNLGGLETQNVGVLGWRGAPVCARAREREKRARSNHCLGFFSLSPLLCLGSFTCYIHSRTYTCKCVCFERERERERGVPQVTRAHHFTLVEFTTLLRRHALQG